MGAQQSIVGFQQCYISILNIIYNLRKIILRTDLKTEKIHDMMYKLEYETLYTYIYIYIRYASNCKTEPQTNSSFTLHLTSIQSPQAVLHTLPTLLE